MLQLPISRLTVDVPSGDPHSCLPVSKGEVWMKGLAVKSKETMKDILVGAPRFELGTSCAQGRRATRLRYAPTVINSYSTGTCNCCLGDSNSSLWRKCARIPKNLLSMATCSKKIRFHSH